MVSAINTALSGLNAAGTLLQVSANNIANQFSTQSLVNGQVVNQPYTPQQVGQVSLSGGGVETVISNVNPATITVPDSSNPQGTAQLPNVNEDGEMVNQIIATYNYKANLSTIKVADDMQKSLLDIIS